MVEHVTAVCKSIDQPHEVLLASRRECRKLANHEYSAFDISGHAFLLIFCILCITEEVKSLRYLTYIRSAVEFDTSFVMDKSTTPCNIVSKTDSAKLKLRYVRYSFLVFISF